MCPTSQPAAHAARTARALTGPQWECHVAQRIEEAAGSAAARLVSRPTHMVPLGSGRGALALYPREDDVTMARVLQAHGDARGVGEALALWYAAQVRPRRRARGRRTL